MGGKRLKFPARQKYKPPVKEEEQKEEKPISDEEHEKRLKLLKDMGIIKN